MNLAPAPLGVNPLRESAADLAVYQATCEMLPGGWELEKRCGEKTSYAALFDPRLFEATEDTSFIIQFLQDFSPNL